MVNSSSVPLISSSVLIRRHSFLSQFIICSNVVLLLVGFCPIVSSSPTPTTDQKTQLNYQSNGLTFDRTTATDDASLSSPTAQHSLIGSSAFWYVQPRTGANQFLLSHTNGNRWYPKSDGDDFDVYVPSTFFATKRSTAGHMNGGYSKLKKRKQSAKPPMEVMNEIVNSIYLKR